MPNYAPYYHGNITFYRADYQPGNEVMLYAHGAFATGWKKRHVLVPKNMSVYFYVPHGVPSSDGAISPVVRGVAAEQNGMTQMANAAGQMEDWLLWGKGSVTSIAGPGTSIWDYELSHNDKAARFIAEMRAVTNNRDLVLVNKGATMHLSDLFVALGKSGTKYDKLHYLPCRSPDKGDAYNPHTVNAAGALHKLSS